MKILKDKTMLKNCHLGFLNRIIFFFLSSFDLKPETKKTRRRKILKRCDYLRINKNKIPVAILLLAGNYCQISSTLKRKKSDALRENVACLISCFLLNDESALPFSFF